MALGDKVKRLLRVPAGLWTESYEESRKDAVFDLEALQAENAKLKKPSFAKMTEEAKQHRHYWIEKCKCLESDRKELQAALAKAEANVAEMLESLEWYGDKENYKSPPTSFIFVDGQNMMIDLGERARETIAKVKEKP